MRISQIAMLTTLLGIFEITTSVNTQQIRVLVLGAMDGKPYAGIEVYSLCEDGGSDSSSQKVKTDINGIAEVPYSCASGVKFKVSTYIEGDKLAECGEMVGQTFQEILKYGYISDPRGAGGIWCPAKVCKKMKPVPGEVILFVKKPTWWQSHVAG